MVALWYFKWHVSTPDKCPLELRSECGEGKLDAAGLSSARRVLFRARRVLFRPGLLLTAGADLDGKIEDTLDNEDKLTGHDVMCAPITRLPARQHRQASRLESCRS